MVVGAFPAAKLGALLLKQISKPIANTLKSQAKSSPVFRKYVCMPPAQFYNWCEVKAKMWILNLGKPVNIPVLNEAMAIELGANLLGEGIIFLIAAGVLINEYNRSSRKEAAKEDEKKREMELMQQTLQEMFFTIEKQGTQIRELSRSMHELESRVLQKPWKPKKTRTESEDDAPPPPPPVLQPIMTLEEIENEEGPNESVLQKSQHTQENKLNYNLVLAAANELENELINKSNIREDSIVTTALNFFYKDVYRVQISM